MRSALRFEDVPDAISADLESGIARDAELLYVHIPFCESLCPYCSFHRYVYDAAGASAYFDALTHELELYKQLGCSFTALYVGGGTPTICPDRLLDIIHCARSLYPLREISVETNPNHLQEALLVRLRDAGVRRLSVGVQSFNDDMLRALGRYEKYGSSAAIQKQLRATHGIFETCNIDLLFNLPLQTKAHVLHDLSVIEELLPDQVTFYPLMTSPSVAATLNRLLGQISYRTEKDFYFTILERMRRQYTGSTAWCFSRHATMIDEYIVTHGRYVGAGSGAFGYHGNGIAINTFLLDQYCQRVRSHRLPITRFKRFSRWETLAYIFLMKLFGLSLTAAELSQIRARYGRLALVPELFILRLMGAVCGTKEGFTLTDRGKYYWVMAMREFFIAVDTLRDVCRPRHAEKTLPH